jgi:hypothetical protein
MTESVPRGVVEAADIVAVSQLLLRERFGRDLGLWEQMRDCYHDDSIVRISWMKGSGPEFVRHSKEMVERGVQANHRLYLRDKVTPVIPGQVLAIDPEAVKAFRPSYRFMSYSLTLSGFPVPNDLPGIDRPDLVDVLVREVYGWAGLAVAC